MSIDRKAYSCIGLVVDNKNCHIIGSTTVYSIVGFKLFEFNSSKLINVPLSEIDNYISISVYINSNSVLIIYEDTYNAVYKCEIVTEPERTTVPQDSPLIIYGEDATILFSNYNTTSYYDLSDAILIKFDLDLLNWEYIIGNEAVELKRYLNTNLNEKGCFLDKYWWLYPESILDILMDGAYLCGSLLLVTKNIDSLVIPSGVEYLNYNKDYLLVKELVCNSELKNIYNMGKLPEKLYISKDTSEELLCNIVYQAIDIFTGYLSNGDFTEHRYSIGAMIGRGEYSRALSIYRSPENKDLLENVLKGIEIIVY